ncbi:MAG: tetratricopeptide repeat protein [Actinomycetes bacterium]
MPSEILDVEQALLLLEMEAPFDQRDVQLARRRMAKRWHPDIAPAGRQLEHERHLQAINRAADQLERLAEQSRGGSVSRNAVKASAAAARKARAEAGRKAYEESERAREQAADQAKNDPFATRMPDRSVVHRYARCLSYPEWGVGSVNGIYFTGEGDSTEQWARVSFSVGIRTVPVGSLQYVEFGRPDEAKDRVERFMTAAAHALAEGDPELAAQRLIYARNALPDDPVVLRQLAAACLQANQYPAAARAARDWVRVERDNPAAHRFLARIYEAMGSWGPALDSARAAAELRPSDPDGWARVGRIQLRRLDRDAALEALERARENGADADVLLDLALARRLGGDVGGEVQACEEATLLEPEWQQAWARYAHALAQTERRSDCLAACERALSFGPDQEVSELKAEVEASAPRELTDRAA